MIMVTADDPDFGPNGVVRYEFFNLVSSKFAITENSGVITTDGTFDYESGERSFTLQVSVKVICELIVCLAKR